MCQTRNAGPRGHRPVGNGLPGMEMTGASLWQAVSHSALRLGVKFESASRAEELLVEEGRVKGVLYRKLDDKAWAAAPYKILTQTAKDYQMTVQPLSRCLDAVADTIWWRSAKTKSLEADAVILAAGGFVSK